MGGCSLRFEDLNTFSANSGYTETNEEPELFREMLMGVRAKKGLAIASGGEIGLLVLAPRVKEELIMVDQSYTAIGASMGKALLIEELGIEKAYALMATDDNGVAVKKAFDAAAKKLPEEIQAGAKQGYPTSINPAVWRREWHYALGGLPLKRVEKALDRVTFVHADIRDLKDRGPFDLIYLSNAIQYGNNRAGLDYLQGKDIVPMLSPKGHVLMTGSQEPPTSLTVIKKITGFRSSWIHWLCRKGE